jgi:hypothetical protein
MSSPKAAAARPVRRPKPAVPAASKSPPRAAAKPAPAVAKPALQTAVGTALSEEAARLAAAIERELAEGRADMLTTEAFHALMGALCRTYAAQIEAGGETLPLAERGSVANTDVMIMASALLRSANLAVFELGMWQSWTGR